MQNMANQFKVDGGETRQVANTLGTVRDQILEKATQPTNTASDTSRQTIEHLASADYAVERDMNNFMQAAPGFVRQHPGLALCVAASVGFVISLLVRKA
jgi:ElaB/YqjD/DUF883 family membrane-anchored ribosome-binding protein